MNYFLSWCRPLLVAFLFHAMTSLLLLHFIEMIFPLVPLIFLILGQSTIKNVMFCGVPLRTRMRIRQRVVDNARCSLSARVEAHDPP